MPAPEQIKAATNHSVSEIIARDDTKEWFFKKHWLFKRILFQKPWFWDCSRPTGFTRSAIYRERPGSYEKEPFENEPFEKQSFENEPFENGGPPGPGETFHFHFGAPRPLRAFYRVENSYFSFYRQLLYSHNLECSFKLGEDKAFLRRQYN
jgi:hypothetical protein